MDQEKEFLFSVIGTFHRCRSDTLAGKARLVSEHLPGQNRSRN